MNIFTKITLVAAIAAASVSVNAQDRTDLLWMAGDATPWGWSLDDASCLAASPENDKVYTGTIYLKADQGLKFLTKFDFGNPELRPATDGVYPDADGKVSLVNASNDDPDNKIMVAESANYLITVDTESMVATFAKSVYQDTPINFAAMFMIGDAAYGWDVDNSMLMRQDAEKPYEFAVKNQALNQGDFKIYFAMKGARSWDKKYYYFRDADDAGKMVTNVDGDNKWQIAEAGDYDVTANTVASTITIALSQVGIGEIEAEDATEAVYYNLQGVRVANPERGAMLIKVAGGKAAKVIL